MLMIFLPTFKLINSQKIIQIFFYRSAKGGTQNQKLNFCWKFPFNLAAEPRTRTSSVRGKLREAAHKSLTFTEMCPR